MDGGMLYIENRAYLLVSGRFFAYSLALRLFVMVEYLTSKDLLTIYQASLVG
jgi:hypothetical protein